MNKEEIVLLDYVFRLAYSECMSDEIFEIINLKEKILKSQKIIKQAIEYNEHLIRDAKYHLNLGHLKKMKKILKGENND